MITCQDARHLFSRYLEGDLPSSLHTELHAHQLNCPTCRDELTMLETCGDVIALDRCEPRLGASFTERVLASRRSQLMELGSRRRTRILLYTGSSLAAAASIAFAVFLMGPWSNKTAIMSMKEKVPAPVEHYLMDQQGDKKVSPKAKEELAETEQMPSTIFSEAMARFLHKTQTTWENTRQGIEDLELLLYLSLSDTVANEEFIKEYRAIQQAKKNGETPIDQAPTDMDQDNPSFPNRESSTAPETDNVSDAL
ncbi:MAG: zf-HC2 domain-containing protein [Planctomycetota bacterium]|nr:MAG: zf-HC2 domain-containing protein [Planctomycetota bacterium]